MIDAELRRYIEEKIKEHLNIILTAQTDSSKGKTETISNLFPGMPSIPDRPVMAPFGFSSKAPKGTKAMVGQHGDFKGNRVVLGHRDEDRPTGIDEGEAIMYSIGKYHVVCFKDKVQVGVEGDYETMVVGETLIKFLIAFLDEYKAHVHTGNLGYPTGAPLTAAVVDQLKSQYLTNNKILAKKGGRY